MAGSATGSPSPLGNLARFGLGAIQNVMGLFAAGAVLFEAHQLFLRYFAREWAGIQIAGVNGCAGEEALANADLLEGQTYCNHPENFVPWVELYRRHWQEAAVYYGVVLVLVLVVGWIFFQLQHRPPVSAPFGQPPALHSEDLEHLS